MSKKLNKEKTAELIFGLALPVGILLFAAPAGIRDIMYPETAIGTEGLENVRKYCIAFILSHTLSALAFPLVIWVSCSIDRALTHVELFSKKIQAAVSLIIIALYFLIIPKVSDFDLQAIHNGYIKHPVIQAVMLLSDINKDIKTNESIITKNDMIKLEKYNFSYSVGGSRHRYRGRSKRRTVDNYQYGIYDKNEKLLGQITADDYDTLSKKMFDKSPHIIETFKYSGLIKSIDGNETVDKIPMWTDS